jgi:hypothetical protein
MLTLFHMLVLRSEFRLQNIYNYMCYNIFVCRIQNHYFKIHEQHKTSSMNKDVYYNLMSGVLKRRDLYTSCTPLT